MVHSDRFRPIDPRQRLMGAAGTMLLTALLGYLLVLGLAPAILRTAPARTTLVNLLPAPPLPHTELPRPRPHRARRQGAASPPNLRAQATPVVAPPPVIPVPTPPPVIAAPIAGVGAQASAGAADVPGPGTGSGGRGNGTGSGGTGDGDGDGGTDLRLLTDINEGDVPCLKHGTCEGGIVYLRFVVGVSGRVGDCAVTRSSGDTDLDTQTCAAIVRHLRYRPATDAAGRPIPTEVNGTQRWHLREGPDRDDRRDDDDD